MLDLVLRGGTLIDGTGAPRVVADVGVRDGRIAAIGVVDEEARREIDATGLVVCPGFIDIHTHYDVQLMWDPAATPSPLHGVTTVIGGNCGFSIAPLRPGHADYVMRLMARVEGMPLDTLVAGASWDWEHFGEWLDRLAATAPTVNAGFLVGHSTVRRLVMGDAAVSEPATEEQIAEMVALVERSIEGGALGFSSSLGEAHTDGDGQPVPSRAASHDEILALCRVLRDHEGTVLEFISAMGEIPDDRIELMADMSLAANRPLNWNLLGSLSPTQIWQQQLSASDRAAERGATVIALALPDVMKLRATTMLHQLDGWKRVLDLPADERRAAVADPATRSALRDAVDAAAARGLGIVQQWDLIELAESSGPDTDGCVGHTIARIATDRALDPVDVLLDLVVPDALPLTMVFPSLAPELGDTDEGWAVRREVWHDDRVVLGGSDAGAHLDLMCHANYPTVVLGSYVRDRAVFTLEQAVNQMTDVPARLLGLRDRGRVEVGAHADLVVFDPETVASHPATARTDLPADGLRLYAESIGVNHVFVGGNEIVTDGELTGERGGRILRSGVDTETVTVPGG
ncbi:MAG: amidohydrolase family protein [Acidimicrobiales bacterium]